MKQQGCAHSIAVNKNRMVTYISCLLLTQLATSWLGRKRLASSYTRFHIDSLKNEHRYVNITNNYANLEMQREGRNAHRDLDIRSDK